MRNGRSFLDAYQEFDADLTRIYRPLAAFCRTCSKCCESYGWAMEEEVPLMLREGLMVVKVNRRGYLLDSFPRDKHGQRILGVVPFCRYAKQGRCSCYAYRPMYCRLYPLILRPLDRFVLLQWDLHCDFINNSDTRELVPLQEGLIRLFKRTPKLFVEAMLRLYRNIYRFSPGIENDLYLPFARIAL